MISRMFIAGLKPRLKFAMMASASMNLRQYYGAKLHARQDYGFNAKNIVRSDNSQINALRSTQRQEYGFKAAIMGFVAWVVTGPITLPRARLIA
jgi:hypothetical protein